MPKGRQVRKKKKVNMLIGRQERKRCFIGFGYVISSLMISNKNRKFFKWVVEVLLKIDGHGKWNTPGCLSFGRKSCFRQEIR